MPVPEPDLRRLDEILARALDLAPGDITSELSADTCGAWDSAAHLRVVFALEEQFAVTLTLTEIEAATSRAAIAALLSQKLAAEGVR
jgi:acyl carrier protein